MQAEPARWLLLVITLPTSSATARMRVWRALKSMGCSALRDGAYLLPASAEGATALRELGDDCIEEGGTGPTIALLRRLAAALDADVHLTAGHDLGLVWFETHAA